MQKYLIFLSLFSSVYAENILISEYNIELNLKQVKDAKVYLKNKGKTLILYYEGHYYYIDTQQHCDWCTCNND